MTRDTLNELDIFSSLSPEEVSQIYFRMEHHTVSKDEVLFQEGDQGSHMYIVLSGHVSISINVGGNEEVEVSQIGEGNFFGEMSLLEKDARSATCRAIDRCTLLSLSEVGFRTLIEKEPGIAIKVMLRMLTTTTLRLQSTGAFLSSMVKWGEDARIRAVTDDFTGLYNRRFFDETLKEAISDAITANHPVSLAMVDLDRFGILNKEYGEDTGDAVILAAVSVFRDVFDKSDILVRYGGDEFAFILPNKSGETALKYCRQVGESLRKIDTLQGRKGSLKHVSASIGIAVCPNHGQTDRSLLNNADKALYSAKEAGRDQAHLFGTSKNSIKKTRISSNMCRNALFDIFIDIMSSRKSFLVTGHREPDEDCIASIMAFSIILTKFSKKTTAVINKKHQDKFSYLLNVPGKNSLIRIVDSPRNIGDDYDTVVALDTPRTSMLEFRDEIQALMQRDDIMVLEIDHHIGADGKYIGDENYRLVDAVSSTCGLIGHLALRLSRKKNLLKQMQIHNLFTLNLLLPLVTGIISDTHRGEFIGTHREKRHFKLFKKLLTQSFTKETNSERIKISSIQDIEHMLALVTEEEKFCREYFTQHKQSRDKITWVALDEKNSENLLENINIDTIASVARSLSNIFAEESGIVSLVAYYDDLDKSDMIQLRMRRSRNYKELDLRKVLERFEFNIGGGHEGAIGFRIPRAQVPDYTAFIEKLVVGTLKLINQK